MWRLSKWPVTQSTHFLEDYFANQMETIVSELANKTEDHIERNHRDGKRFATRHWNTTDVSQSQTSKISLTDMLSNRSVKIKSKQIQLEK